MCHDYVDVCLQQTLLDSINGYQEVSLIAWSMGVWVGQCLFSDMPQRLERKIAVNGTLCPIHDNFGISPETFSATLEHFNETTRLKFYRRMCRKTEILECFLANQPQRDLDNQREELESLLENADCRADSESIYTDIVVADKDFIVPTENQLQYWHKNRVHLVDGYHFLFYDWKSWDEMLQDLGSR